MPKLGRIYYVIPDIFRVTFSPIQLYREVKAGRAVSYLDQQVSAFRRPVGGVKMHYLHCMMLRQAGFDAIPLVLGKRDGNFFGYDIPVSHVDEVGYKLAPNDVVVSTEFHPYDGLKFEGGIRIIFVQNWVNLFRRLEAHDRNKSYLDLGYDHVIVCGKYIRDYVRQNMGIESTAITNGIDQSVFFADESKRVPGRVIGMPRKNREELTEIIRLVRLQIPDLTYVPLHGLGERELAEEYRKADIFAATGYPEGFGLPILEAMRSGVVVAGYSGQGAREFMDHERTALIAEDGNCPQAAECLTRLLTNRALKEQLRAEASLVAAQYSLENTEAQLLKFYRELEGSLAN